MKKTKPETIVEGKLVQLAGTLGHLNFLKTATLSQFVSLLGEEFYSQTSKNGRLPYEQVRLLALEKINDSIEFQKSDIKYHLSVLRADAKKISGLAQWCYKTA